MIFRQLFDADTWTYTYLLADETTREAVLIDSVKEKVERDLKLLSELDLTLVYVLETHVHADHVTGAGDLRERTGAKTGTSEQGEVACADVQLKHGDTLNFGRHTLEVRSTPGHTDGCVTFVLTNSDVPMAFTGDALLIRGCGRTDFQQGSAESLFRSIHSQVFTLPDNTRVYPAHDYRGHTMSTVGEEKANNPRLGLRVPKSEFLEIMANLDLSDPKRIHEALPANLQCGKVEKDVNDVSTENTSA